MQSAKFASTPLPINIWLSQRDCPTSGSEGEDMKSVLYAPAVGSLVYPMLRTRPDISHAVGVISRFMHNPGPSHWNAVKHVFRYLAGTKDHGILFGPNQTSGVVGYTDSDFPGVWTVASQQPNTVSNSAMEQSCGSRNFRSAQPPQQPKQNM